MSAAVILRRQRRIVRAFETADAVSPSSAVDPQTLGVRRGLVFDALRRSGVLVAVDGSRYYLDPPAFDRLRSRQRRIALIMVVLALIVWAFVAVIN